MYYTTVTLYCDTACGTVYCNSVCAVDGPNVVMLSTVCAVEYFAHSHMAVHSPRYCHIVTETKLPICLSHDVVDINPGLR